MITVRKRNVVTPRHLWYLLVLHSRASGPITPERVLTPLTVLGFFSSFSGSESAEGISSESVVSCNHRPRTFDDRTCAASAWRQPIDQVKPRRNRVIVLEWNMAFNGLSLLWVVDLLSLMFLWLMMFAWKDEIVRITGTARRSMMEISLVVLSVVRVRDSDYRSHLLPILCIVRAPYL